MVAFTNHYNVDFSGSFDYFCSKQSLVAFYLCDILGTDNSLKIPSPFHSHLPYVIPPTTVGGIQKKTKKQNSPLKIRGHPHLISPLN